MVQLFLVRGNLSLFATANGSVVVPSKPVREQNAGSMYNTVWTPPADVVRGKPVVRVESARRVGVAVTRASMS